jgi:hypothetical protein
MDDFVDAILETNPDIPVVKGEMPDTWIHGIMSDPGGIKLSRAVHPQIAAAEALHTQLNLWGVAQPPVAKEIALAYENILGIPACQTALATGRPRTKRAFRFMAGPRHPACRRQEGVNPFPAV